MDNRLTEIELSYLINMLEREIDHFDRLDVALEARDAVKGKLYRISSKLNDLILELNTLNNLH
jgi:hypothetical protein